jgi:hypothetical protein
MENYLNLILINQSGQLETHIYRKSTIRDIFILKALRHPIEHKMSCIEY